MDGLVAKKKQDDCPIISPPIAEGQILLHSCCAPCVCEIMETLKRSNIDFTLFFYNPNIDTEDEYEKRKAENIRFAKKLNIPFADADYDNFNWLETIKGYETEPERGKRCTLCFEMRLIRTAQYAYNNGFNVFTSSLGISRWKDYEQVTQCGIKAAALFPNLTYWTYNWRKKGGADRMAQISKRENFYRQQYCGCVFSKKSR